MIPGPIEISPAVAAAAASVPDSHVSPAFIEHFGSAIERMRIVWKSGPDSQPVILAGGGTLAMEVAVANLVEPGDAVLVVNTGYFGDRMAEMLRRRGAQVDQVRAEPGLAPTAEEVASALDRREYTLLAATHVDTSTGVRTDARGMAGAARARGVLSVFDGVCATAGEAFDMDAWGADVYLTASQKAIGLPPGLALLVLSARAIARREQLRTTPPMSMDLHQWLPILSAYEARRPSYFSTPATTLVKALDVGLAEIEDIDTVVEHHARVAAAMRAAWEGLGLTLLPAPGVAADTLSAIRYPDGIGPDLPAAVAARGVAVAGGLHPALKTAYFRVGHMGYSTRRPDHLTQTVRAVGEALRDKGHGCDVDAVVAQLEGALTGPG